MSYENVKAVNFADLDGLHSFLTKLPCCALLGFLSLLVGIRDSLGDDKTEYLSVGWDWRVRAF